MSHGPGDVEWWACGPKQYDKLYDEVMEKFKIDIQKNETMWWPDYKYLISNGYPIYTGVQKAGDIIVVGIGTLHWVKSYDPCVHTAWNVGPKSMEQFTASFAKFDKNEAIGYRNLVPMHTLALDYLNGEADRVDPALA